MVSLPSPRVSKTRALGVELFPLLIVVRDLHVGADPHLAAIRLQFAEEQPQQRGLAGTVRADETDPIAAQDADREVLHDGGGAEGLADPRGFEHDAARRVRQLHLDTRGSRARAPGRAGLPHRQQRAHAALVAGAPRLDALAQPHLLLGEPLVELLLLQRLVREPLVLLAQEGRVVARPRREAPAIELDDARREALEERAVVRHEDQRAGVLGQEVLQPGDRFEVEVVGRFVEQQHVGLRDQGPREQDAPAPSARQRIDHRVGRERQPREHQLDPLLEAPAVALLEGVLQATQPRQGCRRAVLGHLDRGMVVGRHEIGQVTQPLGDHVEDRAIGRERHILLEPRDADPGGLPDHAAVGLDLAGNDAQQRGLAAAVPADDAHALPRLQLQAHLVEQRRVAVGERYAVEREHRHGQTGCNPPEGGSHRIARPSWDPASAGFGAGWRAPLHRRRTAARRPSGIRLKADPTKSGDA